MRSLLLTAGLALAALCPATLAAADDTVTIPKSRLEELERKAAELERLRATNPPATATVETKPATASVPATTAPAPKTRPAPAAARPAPVAVPTAPLEAGEIIAAEDLADHFLADRDAATARYRGKKITVRGRIVGFDKPMFIRNYKVLLQTSEQAIRVSCDIYPPSEYQAIYTTKEGAELVALISERERITLARIGDTVTYTGECKGLKDNSVRLTGCTPGSRNP
jgi:hypothetical protein